MVKMRVYVLAIAGELLHAFLDFRHIVVGFHYFRHGVELALLLRVIHVADHSPHDGPARLVEQLCLCHQILLFFSSVAVQLAVAEGLKLSLSLSDLVLAAMGETILHVGIVSLEQLVAESLIGTVVGPFAWSF